MARRILAFLFVIGLVASGGVVVADDCETSYWTGHGGSGCENGQIDDAPSPVDAPSSGDITWEVNNSGRLQYGSDTFSASRAASENFVVSAIDDSYVTARYIENGSIAWNKSYTLPTMVPMAVGDGKVYFTNTSDTVVAADLETGDAVWSFQNESISDVDYHGGSVYLASAGGPSLTVLNSSTGDQTNHDFYYYDQIAVDSTGVYSVAYPATGDTEARATYLNGTKKWHTAISNDESTELFVANGSVYLNHADLIYKLNKEDGNQTSFATLGSNKNPALFAGTEDVVLRSNGGDITAYNSETGEAMWNQSFDSTYDVSIMDDGTYITYNQSSGVMLRHLSNNSLIWNTTDTVSFTSVQGFVNHNGDILGMSLNDKMVYYDVSDYGEGSDSTTPTATPTPTPTETPAVGGGSGASNAIFGLPTVIGSVLSIPIWLYGLLLVSGVGAAYLYERREDVNWGQ